jgi:hypothetical protein
MAVSTYTSNLTDLYAGAGSTSNWTALGGGASGLNAETDYFIQGTGMTSKNAFASARKGMIFNSGSDRASTIGTDGAVLMWTTHTTPNSLDTIANGGITALVGSSTSDYKHWYVGGSDTITFLQWILVAVNPSETTDEADAGTPTAVEQYFGVLFDLPSGGPTKGAPNAIDAIRVGRCDLIYELGTSTDPDASFQLAVDDKGDVTDRLGLIQEDGGAFFLSGLHQLGSSTNVVNFTDSNKVLFWRDHPAVTAPFNTVDIQNASSVIAMTNIAWKALGSKSPGTWTTTDNATVTLTTCNFTDWGTFTFDSNTTADKCTFLGCGALTLAGADISGSTIEGSTVAADASALVWDVNLDPDGELDDIRVTKGAAAHHAIEFGTTSPLTMTVRGMVATGFNASNSQNDSTFHVKRTSGTVTINVVGGTGNFSYKSDGATVNVVIDPVTSTFTILDNNKNPLQNARVKVEASDGTGDLPFEDSVTITRSGSTATVSHTAHGMGVNDIVNIQGADQKEYNGAKTITAVTANSYDYTVSGTPTSPATGTITATGCVVSGLTDVNGEISDTRTWTNPQPIIGKARKSTASPYFKTSEISGTISTTTGFSSTNVMILDE